MGDHSMRLEPAPAGRDDAMQGPEPVETQRSLDGDAGHVPARSGVPALPESVAEPSDHARENARETLPNPPPALAENEEPRTLFDRLVKQESDLVGMVAHGLHLLSERDWRRAFYQAQGREPDEQEIEAFLLGEAPERRLAGYRRSAEAMLRQAAAGSPEMRAPSDPVRIPTDPGTSEAPAAGDRHRMATILSQFARPSAETQARGYQGLSQARRADEPQPTLKKLFGYLLILALLVACLAILVNYAKSSLLGT